MNVSIDSQLLSIKFNSNHNLTVVAFSSQVFVWNISHSTDPVRNFSHLNVKGSIVCKSVLFVFIEDNEIKRYNITNWAEITPGLSVL